jgi:hypothetical protein
MMMEGMSLRAISRLTGNDMKTILFLLETAGEQCRKIWDAYMSGIRTQFVQADELWTFCGYENGAFVPRRQTRSGECA